MSEWDRLEAEEAANFNNVTPIRDDIPDWMNDMSRYGEPEKPAEPLTLIDPSTWAGSQAPERRWKVKDYIPDGQATLLTGKGAAGKSLVSQLQATCIAMGLPFLGLEVEQTNALYITCEDDQDELQRRQAAICEGLGITLESLSGKLFLLSLQGQLNNELATFTTDGRMSIAPRYEQISAACAEGAIGFLILDNTAHLFTGNENDRHQVASFINLCNRLAIAISGAVVIVGHPNKAGDSYSGSTAWENQVRSRLFMEIPANEQGEIADPDLRVMRREKVNYAQRGGELQFRWFKGTFVFPEAVDDATNKASVSAQDARDNELFLVCLRERNKQRRPVSEVKATRNYAPKEMGLMAESKLIGRARLEAAMDRLFRLGVIERGFLWVLRGESKSAFGLRIVDAKTAPKSSDNLPATSEGSRKKEQNQSDNLKNIGSRNIQQNQSDNQNTISDNLENNAEVPGKTNEINPIYAEDEGSRKILLNQSDNLSSNTPKGVYGRPLGEVSPNTPGAGGDDEPPSWMDEAPPIEPPANGDWRDNPILNRDWKPE